MAYIGQTASDINCSGKKLDIQSRHLIISVLFGSFNGLIQNKRSWRLQIKEVQLLSGL